MHGQFQERIAQENAKLYRPVVTGGGGAGVTREKVLKRAMELRDKHPDLTSEDAQRQALADLGAGPAQGALPVHEKDGGVGKVSPRIQTKLAELDASAKAADELDTLLQNEHFWSPAASARAEALAGQLQGNGFKTVKDNPNNSALWGRDAQRAGLGEVRKQIAEKRRAYEERARNGGGADEPEVGDTK
jgi:hypothetical protein